VEGKLGESKFLAQNSQLRYLDVGVGTGISLETIVKKVGNDEYNKRFIDLLTLFGSQIDVLDISENMLEIVRGKFGPTISRYINSSIYRYTSNCKYDLIVAAMCDPYLTSTFVKKAASLLDNNGILLLTFPHSEWMKRVRSEQCLEKTTFRSVCGHIYKSFSFCKHPSDLLEDFLMRDIHLVNRNTRYLRELSLKHDDQLSSINLTLLDKYGDSKFCTSLVLKKIETSRGAGHATDI